MEAAEDRDAQLRLKREMAERQRHVDRHYHDLLVADVEARRRREELETMERNRANHVQVQALVEQIAASDNSKANRARRVAEEHRYLVLSPLSSVYTQWCRQDLLQWRGGGGTKLRETFLLRIK